MPQKIYGPPEEVDYWRSERDRAVTDQKDAKKRVGHAGKKVLEALSRRNQRNQDSLAK